MEKRINGIQSSVSSKHLIGENGQTVDRNAEKAEMLAHKFAQVSSSANYMDTFRKWKEELESDSCQLNNDAATDQRNAYLNTPFSECELRKL